ncbi:hypothetical protein J2W42_004674 [Rhizobium tibeticum]|nr:hypothetical protein [Rhizobium tibeticum]
MEHGRCSVRSRSPDLLSKVRPRPSAPPSTVRAGHKSLQVDGMRVQAPPFSQGEIAPPNKKFGCGDIPKTPVGAAWIEPDGKFSHPDGIFREEITVVRSQFPSTLIAGRGPLSLPFQRWTVPRAQCVSASTGFSLKALLSRTDAVSSAVSISTTSCHFLFTQPLRVAELCATNLALCSGRSSNTKFFEIVSIRQITRSAELSREDVLCHFS